MAFFASAQKALAFTYNCHSCAVRRDRSSYSAVIACYIYLHLILATSMYHALNASKHFATRSARLGI